MGSPLIVLLIRHGQTLTSGTRLDGRLPDVHVSERGHRELSCLRRGLASVPIDAIYSSPLLRARETAAAIAGDHRVTIKIESDLNELDFGEWTGRAFDALAFDPAWRAFNSQRSSAPVPAGESAADLQQRVVRWLTQLKRERTTGIVAVVSHAEVIRSLILWCTARSLDEFHHVAIDTASASGLVMTNPPRVLFVNATGEEVFRRLDACAVP
jgi:broad specificity phosphatase PhoE